MTKKYRVEIGASSRVENYGRYYSDCSHIPKPTTDSRLQRGLVLLVASLVMVAALVIMPSFLESPSSASAMVRVNQYAVVEPGGTLWSIVEQHYPNNDPRPIVDEIARSIGSSVVYVGERIPLPSI